MLEPEVVTRLMERGTIEVAPLAFMRGRTLNDSFIILDEAQNTTPEQMKMFLTRLGFGSKIVVTGDVTQIDLPEGRGRSGLLAVREILVGVPDLAFVELDTHDVVRHKIVQDIVERVRAGERLTLMAVFASDEQSTLEVDLPRWLRLARLVLVEERAPADAEVSLIFVDEEAIADLNGRFLGGDGPDRRALVPDRRRPPAERSPSRHRRARAGERDRAGRSADRPRRRRGVPDGGGASGAHARRAPSTTSSRCSWSTVCCTC